MLFNSPVFLFLFLPGTVAAYIALRHFSGPRAVIGLLVGVSLLFYGWWNPLYGPLLGSLAGVNFLVARGLAAPRPPAPPQRVSWVPASGTVSPLIAPCQFQYNDFLI